MTVFNPKSTGKVTLNVTRSDGAGSYVKGTFVEGTTSVIAIEANWQPANFETLQRLPEAERSKNPKVIYTSFTLRTTNKSLNVPADIVEILGENYRVFKVDTYMMGVQDHTKAIVIRED